MAEASFIRLIKSDIVVPSPSLGPPVPAYILQGEKLHRLLR